MMKRILLAITILLLASCNSTKVVDVKSPCVSLGEPCGPRRPINDWWLKGEKIISYNQLLK